MSDDGFVFGVIFFCSIFFGIHIAIRWLVWLANLTGLPFDVGLGVAMVITVILGVLGMSLFILIGEKKAKKRRKNANDE